MLPTREIGERSRNVDRLFDIPRKKVLLAAFGLLLCIAVLDAFTQLYLSLGILYIFPILLGAFALKRWEMVVLILCCAVLREHFGPFAWQQMVVSRLTSTILSFGAAGLLLNEIARNRRAQIIHYREMKEEVDRRMEAEGQLRTLVESSPAAIVTLDSNGDIVRANLAAHELFGVENGTLPGASISGYLPTLAALVRQGGVPYRTATNCRGHRADGQYFLACVWFATYQTPAGQYLAAIITDASDELRDFQETSLQNLLKNSRVLVGSVSHEIRNMCAAIAVIHANLGRIPGVAQTEDYAALGTLSDGLAHLATVEMHSARDSEPGTINLTTVMEEFRIVLEPTLAADGIEFQMIGMDELPQVAGDHHALLQVCLNLVRNSIRAMEDSPVRRLIVDGTVEGDSVLLRFKDTGPGVKAPDKLFHAFQQGADAVGLGLFVARALLRASGGELYHEPSQVGCTMCVQLQISPLHDEPGEDNLSEIHA